MTEDEKHQHWNLLYGIHSGIPLCCIGDFIAMSHDEVIDRNEARLRVMPEALDGAIGYVPCFRCFNEILIGHMKPVEIHECRADDVRCQMFSELLIQLFGKPLLFDIAAVYVAADGTRTYIRRDGEGVTNEEDRPSARA